MSVPTVRVLKPTFGKPLLRAANNGSVSWSKVNTLSQWQKGTGWQAQLYGGVQTGDDWAAVFIPVEQLRVKDLSSALWSYYLTNAEVYGVNMVVWAHNHDDLKGRAEITQSGSATGLGKAQAWNSHKLVPGTKQFFFYGENTSNSDLAEGSLYTWTEFREDVMFRDWLIYRISFEYGWYSTGTFEDAWLAEVTINGQVMLLQPSVSDVLLDLYEPVSSATTTKVSVGSSDTTVLSANTDRKLAVFVNDSDEVIYLDLSATAVMNEGIRLNAGGGSYTMDLTNLYTGEVSAICTSGSKNLTVTEG